MLKIINKITDIDKLLMSSFSLKKKRPLLLVEKVDMVDVKSFCLRVKGLEDWMDEEMVKEHFSSEAGGEAVESVELEEGIAIIRYARPKGNSWVSGRAELGACGQRISSLVRNCGGRGRRTTKKIFCGRVGRMDSD